MLGITVAKLNQADRIIKKWGLHEGPPPVDVSPLFDCFTAQWMFDSLETGYMGFMTRRKGKFRHYIRMGLSVDLREPEQTARKRDTQGHEISHAVLMHRGDLHLWRAGYLSSNIEHMEKCKERACKVLTSYFLIPRPYLEANKSEEPWKLAVELDVPEDLVGLRWEIWGKFGR